MDIVNHLFFCINIVNQSFFLKWWTIFLCKSLILIYFPKVLYACKEYKINHIKCERPLLSF